MSDKETIILTEQDKALLDAYAASYANLDKDYKVADQARKQLGNTIKEYMGTLGIHKYESDSGIKFSTSTRQNVSYDEGILINIIKTLGIDGIIKTKEYIDMSELERALYNGKLTAEDIAAGVTIKPDIVSLTCKVKED